MEFTEKTMGNVTRLGEHLAACPSAPEETKAHYTDKVIKAKVKSAKRKEAKRSRQTEGDAPPLAKRAQPAHGSPPLLSLATVGAAPTVASKRREAARGPLDSVITRMSAAKKEALDLMLVQALVTHRIPFRLVESSAIAAFLRQLNPAYQLPSASKLRTSLLKRLEDGTCGAFDSWHQSLIDCLCGAGINDEDRALVRDQCVHLGADGVTNAMQVSNFCVSYSVNGRHRFLRQFAPEELMKLGLSGNAVGQAAALDLCRQQVEEWGGRVASLVMDNTSVNPATFKQLASDA
jgi:hypothetical protein